MPSVAIGLNLSKALGPDKLHPRVLKNLVLYLLIYSNNLLMRVKSPRNGLANICPLYEKGDRGLLSNYCPVSLTCVSCKMLKHIVCTNITA